MNLYDSIVNRKAKISLIGLGYGLPIASPCQEGGGDRFDVNEAKSNSPLRIDITREAGTRPLKIAPWYLPQSRPVEEAKFHIVATRPLTDHTPDLSPVKSASRILGTKFNEGLHRGHESTVYPGVTEEICVPILEARAYMRGGLQGRLFPGADQSRGQCAPPREYRQDRIRHG